MSCRSRIASIRTWCLPVISAVGDPLAAAAFDPEQNWARLRALPSERRAKLVENLKKFDLLYSQAATGVSPRARPPDQRASRASWDHYLAVLQPLSQLAQPASRKQAGRAERTAAG